MRYDDRADAAAVLARQLEPWRGCRPVVLGVPRGAVPMAGLIADALGGDLDVVLVRKIGAPGNPEFAIGAVDESGRVLLTEDAARMPEAHVRDEAQAQLALLRERRERYTPWRPPLPLRDRHVIVVDDGLATGATMLAALEALRRDAPRELVCAVPVAPPETVRKVAQVADAVVCPHQPEGFVGVGAFYRRFDQVDDETVVALLRARSGAAR